LVIPSHTQRQVIIDLEQYVCAYPQLSVSRGTGSRVTIGWAEALHLDASGNEKGQRDEVEGRTFIALCRDVFIPDGGITRQFEPLWWRAGRFIQLLIETGDEPLTIEGFRLLETRYPLEMDSHFSSSDSRLEVVTPVMLRGLQMCAHETYMDCPYYEQLMYVGDTRLEALTTYTISADNRLPRKAIILFELSRLADGFTQARYPSRDVQVIPPFALWWIGMVYDYALWRGDRSFIAKMLPGVHSVLDGFLKYINSDNLLRALDGWNFTDWTSGWLLGVPPDGFSGLSGVLNWHLVYTLGLAAKLEKWAGEDLLAQRWGSWRDTISTASRVHFWDEQRGLFADDKAHTSFSEHTQCLALLSGTLASEEYDRTVHNLLSDVSLTRTTIYFTHYLFETYYMLRQPEAFFKRMTLWFGLPEQGFKTTPEQPEPSRSDCHGWGSHPLYHYFATLLGIRPTSLGFEQVEIAPMPGHLTSLSGTMIHPNGLIKAHLHFDEDRVWGEVSLPPAIRGTFRYAGKTQVLKSGSQQIVL
jgi:alpha-L-rhamnosidase